MKKSIEFFGTNTQNASNNEPLIKPDIRPFWLSAFNCYFTRTLKKAFYSINVKNAENFELRDPNKGIVFFSSHCCWWDGMIGFALGKKLFNTQLHMMIEELYRFPLLAKIGAFSVEKNSPQSAIKALNYTSQLLQNPQNSVWIFPQGIVMPQDYRPIKFANGLSYLYKKLNGVNLIPIAHRYIFVREDRPEVFIDVGKPIILNDNNMDRKEFTHFIESEFTALADKQKEDISSGNYEGYKSILKSRLCLAKTLEKSLKNIIQRRVF